MNTEMTPDWRCTLGVKDADGERRCGYPARHTGNCLFLDAGSTPPMPARAAMQVTDTWPIPGATPLTSQDWADLIGDIADDWEARVLNDADEHEPGVTINTADALRAFARWVRTSPAPA